MCTQMLRTSAQSDHATGHLSHFKGENFFSDLGGFASFFFKITHPVIMNSPCPFTEIRSIPWVSKAMALCQQRGIGYSVQRIVKDCRRGDFMLQKSVIVHILLEVVISVRG